jgi:hypothetical protein
MADEAGSGVNRTPAFARAFVAAGHDFPVSEAWCGDCRRRVVTAPIDAIAAAASLAPADLYARLESGDIHAAETPDGRVEVCLNAPAAFWETCGAPTARSPGNET